MLKSISVFATTMRQMNTCNINSIKDSVLRNEYITHFRGQPSQKISKVFAFSTKKRQQDSQNLEDAEQNIPEEVKQKNKESMGTNQKKRKFCKSKSDESLKNEKIIPPNLDEKHFQKVRNHLNSSSQSNDQQKKQINFEEIKQSIHQEKLKKKERKKSGTKIFNSNESVENKQINSNEKEIFKKESQKKMSFYQILTEQSEIGHDQSFLKFLQKQHQDSTQEKKIKYADKKPVKLLKRKNESLQQQISPKPRRSKGKFFLAELKRQNDFTTLHKTITDVQRETSLPLLSEFEQNFFTVLDPQSKEVPLPSFGLWYYLLRYGKYHVYFSQTLTLEEQHNLKMKIVDTIKFYCLDEDGKNAGDKNKKLPDEKLKYMEKFLVNLLPHENQNFLADIYLEIGIKYFTQIKINTQTNPKDQKNHIPTMPTLYMILGNVKRLIFGTEQDFQIGDPKGEDYTIHRMFFSLYLDFYCMKKEDFETADKISCVQLAKFLKIQHAEFLQFIKETLQTDQQNYSTVEFLIILGYLVESKNTPYEYFYRNKGTWMNIIESAHDFSDKKTKCCIKFLEILSRQSFVHCEKIYFSLLQSIENNLEAMEGKQLVRTLYYYSKARYGANPRFLSNLVDKISRWLPFLEEIHFSLLVRAIGNLNYHSAQLVEKLKNINYERFLCELKFGCERLGSYYQEILKEVQAQSKIRKEYFDGEELVLFDESRPDQKKESVAQKVI